MYGDALWQAFRRFGIEALCLSMVLYGPPLQALAAAQPAGPPVESAETSLDDLVEGVVSTVASVGAGVSDAVTETVAKTVDVGAAHLETFAGQPWTDALAVLLATGAGEEPPHHLLTDAVPPMPPGFRDTVRRRSGVPGTTVSPEALLGSRDHLDAIPLLAGWNLLSIPEEPADPNPAAVLAPLAGSIGQVFAYDACDPVDPWKLYDPADPAASDLLDLDPTVGFWVDATGVASLPSAGTLAPSTSWPLCTGWNLIGYPAGEPRHVRNALQSIEGRYLRVFGFDLADPTDPWEIWDAAAPDWANDLTFLRPGFGYWVLVTEDTTLEIANEADAPTVAITTPTDLAVVTAPTEIRGTVQSPILDNWTLDYRLVGEPEWIELARGNFPLDNAPLATFDPTLLLNGLYEIRLEAVDLAGMALDETIAVSVEGNMKIGHFSMSFTDLAVPVSGLDIEVIRTYDTRDRARVGDFGQGWTLEIRQGSYRNNRSPGDGWQIVGGTLPCQSALESKSHLTTVRLSDREVYRFRLRLSNPSTVLGGCFAEAGFDYVAGPLAGSTLEILGNTDVIYQNGSDFVVDADTLELFEPRQVRLTTRDGRVFDLDLDAGVQRLADPSGNSLTISDAGITHSSGRSISFVRDADGRISSLSDPEGSTIEYRYDAGGDLVSVTDRSDALTTFVYDPGHLLRDVVDPSGRVPLRNEYDDEGRLVRATDARGNTYQLGHDVDGRQEVVTDRLGNARVLEYDDRGNVVRETDSSGNVLTRVFDANDNIVRETNPLGQAMEATYDDNKNVLTRTDALGNTTRFTYNARNQPLSVTDALGNVTRLTYNANGRVTSATDPLGKLTSYTYDGQGNVASVTDPEGATTQFFYDAFGNLERRVDAAGNEVATTYDALGNPQVETQTRTTAAGPQVEQFTFSYDASGRVLTSTDPLGNTTTNTYNTLGLLSEVVDAAGRRSQFSYDVQGQLLTTTLPDGTTESLVYDAEGRVLSRTDRLGRTESFVYDIQGNLTTRTTADGSTWSYVYDAARRLTSTTNPRGFTTRYEYDAAGRHVRTIDALGNVASLAYDAAGNQTELTDPQGSSLQFEYDGNSRLTRMVFPDDSDKRFGFDGRGRQTFETDQAGNTTQRAYDALGRLETVTDALGAVTRYAYDEVGNRISQTDALGNITRFEYDGAQRLIQRTLADGSAESFVYDAVGNRTQATDFAGAVTRFDFDSMGRLTTKTLPDGGVIRWTYDALGNILSVDEPDGLTTYAYDALDRLVSLTDRTGHQLQYQYDGNGNRTQLTAVVGPQSLTTSTTYDALDRVASVTDPAGRLSTLAHDANGNRTTLLHPNGVVTSLTYDTLNRLTEIEAVDGSGTVLASHGYTLGAAGNRLQVVEAGGVTRDYTYDATYRLLGETVSDVSGIVRDDLYTYDVVGNRTQRDRTQAGSTETTAYSYDTRYRLQAAGGTAYQWDVNGQLIGQTGPDAATLTWDSERKLVQVAAASGDAVQHTYDATGHRVRSEVTSGGGPAEARNFLIDPTGILAHVVAETDDQGNLLAFYVRAGDLLVSAIRGTDVEFFHADGLGSIRLLTDLDGLVTDRYDYSAFGELLDHQGSSPNPYLFAGERLDASSGLYDLRARWMDPGIGRFSSPDAFAGFPTDPLSLHPYLYANANPVNLIDPTGNFAITLPGVLIALSIMSFLYSAITFINEPTLSNGMWLAVDAVGLPLSWTKLLRAGKLASKLGVIADGSRAARLASHGEEVVRQAYAAKGWRLLMAGDVLIKRLFKGQQGKKAVDFIHAAGERYHLTEVTTRLRTDEVLEAITKFEDTTAALIDFGRQGGLTLDEIAEYRLVVERIEPGQLRQGFELIQGRLWKDGAPLVVNGRNVIVETVGALQF